VTRGRSLSSSAYTCAAPRQTFCNATLDNRAYRPILHHMSKQTVVDGWLCSGAAVLSDPDADGLTTAAHKVMDALSDVLGTHGALATVEALVDAVDCALDAIGAGAGDDSPEDAAALLKLRRLAGLFRDAAKVLR
jgi:hypothetical protein